MSEDELDLTLEDRAANFLPDFIFWGEGIVVIKQKDWWKSRNRIKAILKQLHKAKIRAKEKQ